MKFYPVRKNLTGSLSVTLDEFDLEAPIMESQSIAEISVFIEKNKVFSTNIVSSSYISKKSSFDYEMNYHFETRVLTEEGMTTTMIGDWGGPYQWQKTY